LSSEACGDDAELRRELESLLAADGESAEFLARPVITGTAPSPDEASLTGQVIGHYRVGVKLGQGGMSTVYLATRADDTYEQQVALKVLDCGTNRSDLAARFRSERQIMASLDHPGIARLLDGGTTTTDDRIW
jgi:serine/threonine protein kinase